MVPEDELDQDRAARGGHRLVRLDPEHSAGAKLRQEYGLVIGHIGIVIIEDGLPRLVHAASSDLPGWYEGGTVVTVPLVEYLQRVDRYSAVMVTRFK